MMNLDHFSKLMEPLIDLYSVIKPDKKLQHYYKHLRETPAHILQMAVDDWSRSGDRFPSINQLAEKIREMKRRSSYDQAVTTTECKHCRGDGVVTATDAEGYGYSFRCHCENAARYSEKLPEWFGHPHDKFTLQTPAQASDDIDRNPEVYRKGYAVLKELGLAKRMPEHLRRRFEALDEEVPF